MSPTDMLAEIFVFPSKSAPASRLELIRSLDTDIDPDATRAWDV